MDPGLCHPRDGEVGRLLQQEEKVAKGAENGSGDEDLLMRLSVQAVTSTLASHHNYVDLVWTSVHRNHYSSIYCRSFIIYTVYAYCIYIHMYSLGCSSVWYCMYGGTVCTCVWWGVEFTWWKGEA